MNASARADTYAAVDLGSNSFHMLVARREHGEPRVIDRIRETVCLAGGLDGDGRLDRETQQRALACLARFGQRLRGIPADNMRAVGTQTFRRLRDANAFLDVAESALGCGIEVIGGREEARLIYLGVSQGVSGHEERRLVIDIGGGSTELVIGKGLEPIEMESVQFGCVSLSQRFFADGRLKRQRWDKALDCVMAELQELRVRYLQAGWQTAIGSSGTVLAAAEICQQLNWIEKDLDAAAIKRLRDRLLDFDRIEDICLPGLVETRARVLIGGLVMLAACFEILGLETLKASPFALREGVLHDLLGRLEDHDPREKTILAFMSRYAVDRAQAERVKRTALKAAATFSGALRPAHRQMLAWAADLHEVGLGVSHSQYQLHSGYLVRHSDMAGFTNQEQLFLSALVGHHRRPIPRDYDRPLPARLRDALRASLFCLRLACVLCRTRESAAIPDFGLLAPDDGLVLQLDQEWQLGHPLTMADLHQEMQELRAVGLQLVLRGGGKNDAH